jgi:hypothetical protein
MRSTAMRVRRLFVLGFAAALLTALGCSNSDNGGTTTNPALGCTDGGAVGADAVNTNCGGATDSVTEQVDVVMGGTAAGSTTLRGLNFDVTYDPAKLTFVPAANYASPLFPSALVAVSLSQAGRVVASIQQTGGDLAVTVPAGSNVVLSLAFQRVSGATFGPTPLTFQNAEATSPSTAITFASGVALSYQ